MVEQHGTSYDADIPVRVSHLEGSVDRLHADNQATQRTLAGVVSQLESVRNMLTDVAGKLDRARTQRPNMVPIIAVAISAVALLVVIGSLALAPLGERVDELHRYDDWSLQNWLEQVESRGAQNARLDRAEDDIRALRNEMLGEQAMQRAGQ